MYFNQRLYQKATPPPVDITSRGIILVMHPRLQSGAELIKSNFLRFLIKIRRAQTATVIERLKK